MSARSLEAILSQSRPPSPRYHRDSPPEENAAEVNELRKKIEVTEWELRRTKGDRPRRELQSALEGLRAKLRSTESAGRKQKQRQSVVEGALEAAEEVLSERRPAWYPRSAMTRDDVPSGGGDYTPWRTQLRRKGLNPRKLRRRYQQRQRKVRTVRPSGIDKGRIAAIRAQHQSR